MRVIRIAFVLLLACAAGVACAESYRTPNFVVTAPTQRFAKQVGDYAEEYRRELALMWLGQTLPKWAQPCPITLQVGPQLGAGGATSFVFDRGEVFNWQMSIQGSEERILDSVLPHEINHTIFASYFRQPLPRWADEGACTTVEHPSERRKQSQMLVSFLKEDRGIAFSRMFVMKEYPRDVMPLYAQGYSLCRFLLEHDSRGAFVNFVRDGLQSKQWSTAVRSYYEYADLAELQAAWLSWIKAGSPSRRQSGASQVVVLKPIVDVPSDRVEHRTGFKPKWDPYKNCFSESPDGGDPKPPAPAASVEPVAPLEVAPTKSTPVSEPPADGPKVVHLTESQLFELVERMAKEACPDKSCQPCRGDADGGSNPASTRASGSLSAGWLKWLGDVGGKAGVGVLTGLGVSAPAAAIAVWLGRRAYKRAVDRAVAKITGHSAPPPNIVERVIERPVDRVVERVVEKTRPIVHNRKETQNRFVRIETTDAAGEAYRKAIAEEAEAHPELAAYFQSIEAGAQQHLNGHRARQRMNLGWKDPE